MADTTLPEHTLPDRDKDLEVGQKVGEYVIEGLLGAGGFGTVFRASHPVIGKQAAIKVLKRQFSVQREMVSRFIAEARAVNQIRHRNIIDIFAFSTLEDGRHYYVMELLDGSTLGDHLDAVGAMSLREALPILRAVGRALDAAHAKGIAHRDLKPENIFLAVDSDGGVFPKLLDFGIAKLLVGEEASGANHKTRTGAPIGTPLYMSPEQCRGRDIDHRTDIYSFGIVAFRMLTGKLPFDAEDYMTILMRQMADTAPPPSSLVAELPVEVDRAIASMMEKEPAARPGSLAKAVEALERAAGEAGAHGGAVTWNATPPPSSERRAASGSGSSGMEATLASPTAAREQAASGSEGRAGELGKAATMQSGEMTGPGLVTARHTTPEVTPPLHPPRQHKVLVVSGMALLAAAVVAFTVLRRQPGDEQRSARERQLQAQRLESERTAATATANPPTTTPEHPPTPAPAPALPTEPALPAATDTVRLTFTGLPDAAIIYGEGHRALGLAAQGLTVPRSATALTLTFEVDGRVLARRRLVPEADAEIAVMASKSSRRGARGKPGAAPSPGAPDPNSTERPPGL